MYFLRIFISSFAIKEILCPPEVKETLFLTLAFAKKLIRIVILVSNIASIFKIIV